MQEIKVLFDNNLSLLYSVIMSIWAAVYLELWKRYSALLTHRWGQRSADRPYNTEIVFISQNEGKSLRKDFQI